VTTRRPLRLCKVVIRQGASENEALLTTYFIVMEVADVPHIAATAIYRDSRAVRTPSGWKFVYRRMDVDDGYAKLIAQQAQAKQQS
jgi:hypothetical protein